MGIKVDDFIVNALDGVVILQREVFVENEIFLTRTDVLWRAQCVYCHEYRIVESLREDSLLRWGDVRDEGVHVTLEQAVLLGQ